MPKSSRTTIPVILLNEKSFSTWKSLQTLGVRQWVSQHDFTAKPGQHCLLPGKNGALERVLCGVPETLDIWSIAHLPAKLPKGDYTIEGRLSTQDANHLALGWELAQYQFSRYKKSTRTPVSLKLAGADMHYVATMRDALCWARDLINTPANDMHPAALATEAVNWAKKVGAQVKVIKGDALLKENYPLIYTVGKASSVPPHLVDIRFAKKGAKKVTLVGKGVCFDSGGLDIKSSAGMKLMKKDMGGAAAVLALAKTLIDTKVNIELRVLLPIVENAIAGNAMRPSDIVTTRSGLTVEIGNTDAEGRLILCDALTAAQEDAPDVIIDCATLTGAARVALGTEIPAFFTNDDVLADKVATHSKKQHDPLWRLPLYTPYRSMLESKNADLSNDPDSSYGGAITAALYLKEFVSKTPSWLHIDMMAWNVTSKPGRPQGGEAMAVRALYSMIKEHYGS